MSFDGGAEAPGQPRTPGGPDRMAPDGGDQVEPARDPGRLGGIARRPRVGGRQ
jgi:hypothetical protein